MPKQSGELGKIGQYKVGGFFYEEFLKELRGIKGVEVYKEMSNNDEVIFAMLFAVEMLMRQTKFHINPASDSAIDKEAAEFVDGCLNDMQYTWQETLSEIMSFITYGWSYHEIVYKRRMGKKSNPALSSKYDDGLIGWKKLPIRSQDTLYEWKYDENTDDLLGMVQSVPQTCEHILIPIEKALHFVTRSSKANPEGRSILRGSYRSWYFKKRIQEIEGIGIERSLAGFPVITAPEGIDIWDVSDQESVQLLAKLESYASGISQDAIDGLVLPNGFTVELLSSGSNQKINTNEIIGRYNRLIATTVLADFIFLGQDSVGSFALSSDKTKLFASAIGTYLDIICEVFNNQAIPRLIDINGDHFKGITDYPEMTHEDIETPNLSELADFISKMVSSGALFPDPSLDEHLRSVASLPERVDDYEMPLDPLLEGNEGEKNKKKKKIKDVSNDPSLDDKLKEE